MQKHRIDRTGEKRGSWTIVSLHHRTSRDSFWTCECECGERRVSTIAGLRQKCIKCSYKRNKKKYPVEYRCWVSIRSRCNANPGTRSHKYYSGRGIKVCDRWSSFENFYSDMGPRPEHSNSIDRIDNNGPYSPENCRWANQSQQRLNTRNTVYLEIDGVRKHVSHWRAVFGISQVTYNKRIRSGLTPLEAVTLKKKR